jgi:hypothetical protein
MRYNNNNKSYKRCSVKIQVKTFAGDLILALGLLVVGYGLIFRAAPFFWDHESSAAFEAAAAAVFFGALSMGGAVWAVTEGWKSLRGPVLPATKA